MSDVSRGHGWWQASDGKWYPPESHPHYVRQPKSVYVPAPTPREPGAKRSVRKPLAVMAIIGVLSVAGVTVYELTGVGDFEPSSQERVYLGALGSSDDAEGAEASAQRGHRVCAALRQGGTTAAGQLFSNGLAAGLAIAAATQPGSLCPEFNLAPPDDSDDTELPLDQVPFPPQAIADADNTDTSRIHRIPGLSLTELEAFYESQMPPGEPWNGLDWCEQDSFFIGGTRTLQFVWQRPGTNDYLVLQLLAPEASSPASVVLSESQDDLPGCSG